MPAGPGHSVIVRAATIALFVVSTPTAGAGQELMIESGGDRLVRFVSETSLEAFDGRTEAIDGYVWLGEGRTMSDLVPGVILPEGRLYFEVDLASIETGISLRDRHMREDYLETKEYPFTTFEGVLASVTEHPEGGLRVTSPGTFTLHGVERTRTIDCRVTEDAPRMRVHCAFTVSLADHDIEIPQVMFLKLAEQVRVELDFHLRPSGDAS